MSLKKPPVTTYVNPSPSSKSVDLTNLCRRLMAEFQYVNLVPLGNFVQVFKEPPGRASDRSLELLQNDFKNRAPKNQVTPGLVAFMNQLALTRYKMVFQIPLDSHRSDCSRVTAKKFKEGGATSNLKPEELLTIYWRARMRFTCDLFSMVLGQIVDDFRKLKYKGFLLPNGKVVPFESMHQIHFWILPKELHLIDYQPPEDMRYSVENPFADFPAVIEDLQECNSDDGFALISHVALAFNLPEKDDEGSHGKIMIIDPTCAQFGMKGENREMIYWGTYQDYVKALPVKKLTLKGFKNYNYMDTTICRDGPKLIKGILANLNSDSCGYCGEVEREGYPMKLKTCSKCMKVFYCDVVCQKLGWKSHKFECKCE